MTDRLDAVTPEMANFTSCAVCGEPTPVPLTWKLRPPEANEPDPPVRVVVHDRCEGRLAEIVEAPAAEPDDE